LRLTQAAQRRRSALVVQSGPDVGGVGGEGETVSRGVRGENKLGPELWRDLGKRGEAQRLSLGAIDGIGKGFSSAAISASSA
jgi:hypothetical protein